MVTTRLQALHAAGAGPPSRVLFRLDYFLTFHKGRAVILTIRFIDNWTPIKENNNKRGRDWVKNMA